jgi:hypothetical protein
MTARRRLTQAQVAQRGVELHERLRAFLLDTMPQEPPEAIALALLYEHVSIVACEKDTEAEAQALLRRMFLLAAEQLAEFGVGGPHP